MPRDSSLFASRETKTSSIRHLADTFSKGEGKRPKVYLITIIIWFEWPTLFYTNILGLFCG